MIDCLHIEYLLPLQHLLPFLPEIALKLHLQIHCFIHSWSL